LYTMNKVLGVTYKKLDSWSSILKYLHLIKLEYERYNISYKEEIFFDSDTKNYKVKIIIYDKI